MRALLSNSALAAAVLLVALPCQAGKPSTPPAPLPLRLRILLADCPSADDAKTLAPVQTQRWIEAHVAAATRILGAHGIAVSARYARFTPRRCTLLSRQDRHEQARFARMDGTVTVLVFARIRDVDDPAYELAGVHWRYVGRQRQLQRRRWVFLTSVADPPVLAHELGHFLGQQHDTRGGNIMTLHPSSPIWAKRGLKPRPRKPIFTTKQGRRMHASLRRYLRTKR